MQSEQVKGSFLDHRNIIAAADYLCKYKGFLFVSAADYFCIYAVFPHFDCGLSLFYFQSGCQAA